MAWFRIATISVAVVVCLGIALLLVGLVVDWAWFSDVGYVDVFWTTVWAKTWMFFASLAASSALLWLNGAVALRYATSSSSTRSLAVVRAHGLPPWPALMIAQPHAPILVAAAALLLGLIIAFGEAGNWDVLLRFVFQVPHGNSDPVFARDLGFYLFSLPAYIVLRNWLVLITILSALLAVAVYWLQGAIRFDQRPPFFSDTALRHGSVLLGALLAVKAWSYALDRYLLLYGNNGVVFGASYTDVHVDLPVLTVLIVLATTAAVGCWANLRVRSHKLPVIAVALLFASSFLLGELFPAVFQRFVVKPNELELERPYIERTIGLTREAYKLDTIRVRPFPAEQSLTFNSLQANEPTIDNIRLWDWEALIATYRQLQEIRTYYKFHDVDDDRYWLDGAYRQVTLAVRELNSALLPPNAQTWVNRHIFFTHGNGVVMSPVTRKTAEGLPVFYLQDIPPVAAGGPDVREPRIYFGELTDTYVIVNGSTAEFDYPKGKENAFARYGGIGGVSIGSTARKALFAWHFNDPNLLLSDYITSESKILFRRTIQERVQTIAPFLRLDHDPYPVVSDGRLFWIQDGYTTSNYFPYSQSTPSGELNYIRNAAKVVVDAYNGTVDFYLADASDPIAVTYQRAFPTLFKTLADLPSELQRHIRYPEDLFLVQAQVFRTYHMDAPEVFYNREDLWQFPRQPDGEHITTMSPYYMVMRLPGEADAEFILMLPMVPSQRENMIAWLAARCDPPHYGELIAYEFPKEKLVFGPFQIEARINQNTTISQQLSLWNQLGSRVLRGNLHAIPIEDSILYVSPLYLRAATGQIPELKRVIAAYGDQVVMEETLGDALAALFRPPVGRLSPHQTSEEALNLYNQALERLRAGDWAGFGTALESLRSILEETGHPRSRP
jgi:uncharacterized membrane protein (UPF0182 family)